MIVRMIPLVWLLSAKAGLRLRQGGRGVLRLRWLAFALIAAVVLAIGSAYLINAFRQQADAQNRPAGDVRNDQADVLSQPHIVFVSTQLDESNSRVAAVPLADPRGSRVVVETACERVTSDGDVGICLTADRGVVTTDRADVLGPDLRPIEELAINGSGSRTRIGDNGRLAATTTFITGHSYNQAGFSTETLVHDLATGDAVNLEEFTTILDGEQSTAVDRNVWGVTFAEDDTFFATVATGGSTCLVEGDLSERALRSLRKDAECPLSPDGTRIVYKKRASGATWRLHVLPGYGRGTPTRRNAQRRRPSRVARRRVRAVRAPSRRIGHSRRLGGTR